MHNVIYRIGNMFQIYKLFSANSFLLLFGYSFEYFAQYSLRDLIVKFGIFSYENMWWADILDEAKVSLSHTQTHSLSPLLALGTTFPEVK